MKSFCKAIIFLLIQILSDVTFSQPYIDLVNIRHTNSPDAGLIHNKEQLNLQYFNISTTLPLQLPHDNMVIFSPYYENWKLKRSNASGRETYSGWGLPVSFLKEVDKKRSVMLTGIIRKNDSGIKTGARLQIGGAIIAAYRKSENLVYKGGLYVNGEYFGLFIMPLLGIDWRIDEKNVLFGVLPGNFTFQHRITSKLAYGASFRAQTNSYGTLAHQYTRIDENQLGAFADIYLMKNFVLNVEIGHSILRKLRTPATSLCNCEGKYYDHRVNDNVYFKTALAYRIVLEK